MWYLIGVAGLSGAIVLTVIIWRLLSEDYYKRQDAWLINEFSRCNVIVYGKKGTGKDLIFAHVIDLRGQLHYANMAYDCNTDVITLNEVSVGDNTYAEVIADNVIKITAAFELGCDIYISDAGIYLPSQYHKDLDKHYKSMPLLYATSRQLYCNNIHANVQNLGRLWDKLREQADSYIRCRETTERGKYLYVRLISYEEYNAAARNLLPCNDKQFRATNGDIRERVIRIPKNRIQYDTYYFRSIFIDDGGADSSPLSEAFRCLETKKRAKKSAR